MELGLVISSTSHVLVLGNCLEQESCVLKHNLLLLICSTCTVMVLLQYMLV